MERLFSLSGLLVMPFWFLMIVGPRWRLTERLLRSVAVVLGPVLLYAVLVLPAVGTILPVVAHGRLAEIAALLATPLGVTVAWAHFLAFDLFVGRWIFLDARARDLTAWLVSPLLLLTFMLGPLGLLAYLGVVHVALSARRRRLAASALAVWRTARDGSRPLAALVLGSAVLLGATLLLQLVDARQVLGVSTWVKPAKFAASVGVTALSLALLYGALDLSGPGLRRAARVIAAMTWLELALIVVQAARGVPSHFNDMSTLDFAIFQAMGIGITIFWFALGYVTRQSFRHRAATTVVTWGARLGLVAALSGSAMGFVMTRPAPEQVRALAAGAPTMFGAHTIGARDGGPGLPVAGWSTRAGDLRVPHFIGLHGLQLLPLLAWWLSRRSRAAAPLILIAGLGYLGVMLTALVQALRGQPLLAPDALTWGLLIGLATACVLAVPWTVRRRGPVAATR
jgi:hypothetical protein